VDGRCSRARLGVGGACGFDFLSFECTGVPFCSRNRVGFHSFCRFLKLSAGLASAVLIFDYVYRAVSEFTCTTDCRGLRRMTRNGSYALCEGVYSQLEGFLFFSIVVVAEFFVFVWPAWVRRRFRCFAEAGRHICCSVCTSLI